MELGGVISSDAGAPFLMSTHARTKTFRDYLRSRPGTAAIALVAFGAVAWGANFAFAGSYQGPNPVLNAAVGAPTLDEAARPEHDRAGRDQQRGSLQKCAVTSAPKSHANGKIPDRELCALPNGYLKLHPAAANAFWELDEAFKADFGHRLCVSDGYRSYEAQVDAKRRKPNITAKPGTSNHGWGVAIDACEGADEFGTPEYKWLKANAEKFGWKHPDWAEPDGNRPEPWHWEFEGA